MGTIYDASLEPSTTAAAVANALASTDVIAAPGVQATGLKEITLEDGTTIFVLVRVEEGE